MNIYDISIPLVNDLPVYPGDPPVSVEPVSSISEGDAANVARLTLSSHAGTHIDAPRHYIDRGISVDHIPLAILNGRALVVEFGGINTICRRELERLPIRGEERLLLKTENSLLWNRQGFREDYVSLSEDGADYLVGIGVRLVGIDYLSIESFAGSGTVHRKLLEHGIIILEGLNLDGVPRGSYELLCLPLSIKDGDGAPARAILRQKDASSGNFTTGPHTTRRPLA